MISTEVLEFAESLLTAAEAVSSGNGKSPPPKITERGAVGVTILSGIVSDPFENVAEFADSLRFETIRNMIHGDAKVYGAHQARMLPLRQANWTISPDPDSDEIAHAVDQALFRRTMKRSWRDVIYDATMATRWGFSLLEQVWRLDERLGRYVWDDWSLRLPWTIAKWNADEKGNWTSVEQEWTGADGAQRTATIPREYTVHFLHERVGNDPRGTPLCRFMWKHYRLKGGLEKIDAVAAERNAMGVPKWMLPRVPASGDEGKAETIVENVRTHHLGGVVVPFGHDFGIEGVSGTVRESVPSIRYHGEEISLATLANFLDLGKTQSGARAVADPQLDLFQLVLLGDGLYYCSVLDEAIRRFVDLNFGPQERYPESTCSLLTNRRLDLWLDAVSKAKTAGSFGPWSPADEAFVRKESGLPEVDESQRRKEEQAQKEREKIEREKMEKAGKPEEGDAGSAPPGSSGGD